MSDAVKDLNQQHPDYKATQKARTVGRDFYEGADAVKKKRGDYLFPETDETSQEYELRLKRAIWEPHVDRIITARQAMLFRKHHERKLPGMLDSYRDNIDLKGTSIETFFQQVARDAQIDGVRWVCVDMPVVPEGGFRSLLEEHDWQHRPFVESIPGDNVIDWEVGSDLGLDWAVVKTLKPMPRIGAGEPASAVEQWKVWYRDRWELYEAANDEASELTLVAEGSHQCGAVPLTAFRGTKHTDWTGLPVCRPIFDHLLALYNKTSNLDHFERLTSHPLPWIVSPEKPNKLDGRRGFHLKSLPGGGQISLGLLEPTGAGLGSLNNSIQDIRRQIPILMLAQAAKESAQVQAAESQREDRRIFTASLASASREFEGSEAQVLRHMAAWAGQDPDSVDVRYTRDFDDTTMDPSMIAALTGLVDMSILTRKTMLQALVDGEAVVIEDIEEELKAAEEEGSAKNTPVGATARLISGSEEEPDE